MLDDQTSETFSATTQCQNPKEKVKKGRTYGYLLYVKLENKSQLALK